MRQRPNAITEYIEFQACGHVPMDEKPDEFVAAVTPFIDRMAASQASSKAASSADGIQEAMADLPDQPLEAVDLTKPERDALPIGST